MAGLNVSRSLIIFFMHCQKSSCINRMTVVKYYDKTGAMKRFTLLVRLAMPHSLKSRLDPPNILYAIMINMLHIEFSALIIVFIYNIEFMICVRVFNDVYFCKKTSFQISILGKFLQKGHHSVVIL